MVELFKAPASRLIYVFRINDPAHKGAVKIGEATYNGDLWPNQLTHDCKELRRAAHTRIKQYTQTAGIVYELVWATPAFSLEDGIKFNDKEIHQVLVNSGFKKRQFPIAGKATEWIECDPSHVAKAIEAIKQGRKMLNSDEIEPAQEPIDFRDEQLNAINMAVDIFRKKGRRALWNAKMRFGKTLSALQVVKLMQFKRTLILTHRPVVNASWFEDFQKIFFDTAGRWIYGSKAANIPFDYVEKFAQKAEPNSYVYFASMQDLRGSSKAGGKYDKNNELFACDWDFIIVDEAHEGTQTQLGQAVLEGLKKKNTRVLSLSGTPFNIQDEFTDEETFTWDYTDEQKAKQQWEIDHPGDYNPYGTLPTMNIYTYDLGRLMSQKQFSDKEVAFNFREFFRTDDNGKFVHEYYVKQFLDLLTTEDHESLYPFANKKFRNIFRHTLWMVPGVKEAAALEELLLNHDHFGARGVKIVNVAGNMDILEDDEALRYNNALTKLREAIGDNPFASETITLSCGRLTTGVSVPEWTGVLMLSGSFNTAAAAYMQTIFRVQTPWEFGGLMKDNCYVFDFAPDRTLTVLAEVARVNTKPGKADSAQKERLGEFLNYCSVIAEPGSQMKPIDANRLMERVKKVYIDRVVRSGFEDGGLYSDELLKLTDVDIKEFDDLKGIIGKTKAMGKTNDITVNDQGLTNEEYAEKEKLEKKKKQELTEEEKARLEELKKKKKVKEDAISILRGISIRMPLMIYGAKVENEDEELTIDNFTKLVGRESWEEFMPKGVTMQRFNAFKKYYDPDIFTAAAKRIRQLARAADHMSIEERIERIAAIFATFRNPDKETVLTPWRVVNMHMSDTLGSYTFFNEDFSEAIGEPRFVDRGSVTAQVFSTDSRLLEINSKSGLYPLYLAYNIYRARLRNEMFAPKTLGEHQAIWDKAVAENIFVICKTPMAKSITRRTLLGFRKGQTNMWAPEDLINKIKNQPELFIKKVHDLIGKDVRIKAIVGNPPYQVNDGSGASDDASNPVYQDFVCMAKTLKPQFISIIMPSKWMVGGKVILKPFRLSMMKDNHIALMVDYENDREIFPSAHNDGGICYFLYDESHDKKGQLRYIYHLANKDIISSIRTLADGNTDIIIRDGRRLSIIEKVSNGQRQFKEIVSLTQPYGIRKDLFNSPERYPDANLSDVPFDNCVKIYGVKGIKGGAKRTAGYIRFSQITKNASTVDKYKLFFTTSYSTNAITPPPAIIADKNEICTETFLLVGPFASQMEQLNCNKFFATKFFKILLFFGRGTMQVSRDVFRFIPLQNFTDHSDIDWSKSVAEIDAQLYAKYNLSAEEIAFIESMIKPM